MSFPDLAEFVQGTFHAFSGADDYEEQLTLWCYRQRIINSQKAKRLAAWKRLNKRRQREHARRWEAAHPDSARARKARWRKANPEAARLAVSRWRAANPEKVREWNRRNHAAYRARKKAERERSAA